MEKLFPSMGKLVKILYPVNLPVGICMAMHAKRLKVICRESPCGYLHRNTCQNVYGHIYIENSTEEM